MKRTAKDLKAVYGELQERLNQNIGRQIKALKDNESSDLLVTEEERITIAMERRFLPKAGLDRIETVASCAIDGYQSMPFCAKWGSDYSPR